MRGLIKLDMKISGVLNAYSVYSTTNQGQKKTDQAEKNEAKDSFSISEQAGEFQTLLRALTQLPDVREDRVAQISERISAGSYNISANDIAAKIFRNA
jgi:negative regulator of flagellin synthesis FlgM